MSAARAAYGQFMDFLTQAMNTWAKSPAGGGTPVSGGPGPCRRLRQGKCRRSFGLASELARAKDVQEVLTLQSRYAQTQMQLFAVQAQQLSWLMADAMRDLQSKG